MLRTATAATTKSFQGLFGLLRRPLQPCVTTRRLWGVRFFSSQLQPIRILYGSQGGTAQVFGMQIKDEIEEQRGGGEDLEFMALNEATGPIFNDTHTTDALHIILVSVAGVGEPPDNARQFYDCLMASDKHLHMRYTIFGLGNSIAHPNNFNVISKTMDSKLQQLGAHQVYPLGLGDDGDCIEDDFDIWMDGLLRVIRNGVLVEEQAAPVPEITEAPMTSSTIQQQHDILPSIEVQSKPAQHEALKLSLPDGFPTIHPNLLHVPFYQSNVDQMVVVAHDALSVDGGEQGLRELTLQLPPNVTYETGDHMILYPRNSSSMVDAILNLYKPIDPHSIIIEGGPGYPHPTGISIYETLVHSVDLGAVPSPSLARFLLNVKDMNYKQDIVAPSRTVLDLILQTGNVPPLQDLLHLLPKMQPRYYSIASSPKVHPCQAIITYRPVKYLTTTGTLREGVCTSHMLSLRCGSHLVGAVRSNPTFRLPVDLHVPIIMIAGGCGIAPIRAFLEDRLASYESSNSSTTTKDSDESSSSLLFLGFRSPSDQVYADLVDQSLARGSLSQAFISYSSKCTSVDQKCQLVTETVRDHGDVIWDWIENRGAHVYLCGGARSFGAAMQTELLNLMTQKTFRTHDEATLYLRQLIAEGRLCEDLAD